MSTVALQKGVLGAKGKTAISTPVLKAEAVQLVRSSGRSISQIAKDLGVSGSSLRNWVKQAHIDQGERQGLTTEEREETAQAPSGEQGPQAREGLLEKSRGGFNWSVQHGRVIGIVQIGGMGVANLGRPGLSAVCKKELWDRWKAGESISDIARALEKPPGSIHGILKATGGIAPPQRCRSRWALTLAEREEISRGLAAGESMRAIAARLGRPTSTVSREIARNGGRRNYRAAKADARAWERARLVPRDASCSPETLAYAMW